MKRQRITIQRETSRQNEVGEILYRWEFFCSTWAEFKGGGVVSIRYRDDLSVGDRAVIADAYFEIVGVVDRREARLIELHIKPQTERDRSLFPRSEGEQQRFRASLGPWRTQSNRTSLR